MKVELLTTDDPAWTSALERVAHDFYHLPRYAELCTRTDGAIATALLVEDGERFLLQPLLRRALPAELATSGWDAISPYGYPGPLVAGDSDFVERALDEGQAALRSAGCVSVFARLHTMLPAPTEALRARSVVEDHGSTVWIDLRETEAEHWSQTRSGHRNEINRAIRAGHRVYFDDAFEHLAAFARMYRGTMERVHATDYYFFDDDYFTQLRDALGPRLRLAVVEIEGQLAAAGLFTFVGSGVQYHLSASEPRFRKHQPTKLMLHFVRTIARNQRGLEWFHLGGGLSASRDSLYDFKAGFSKHRSPFATWRWIVDRPRYESIARARHGEDARLNGRGFFPEYRRPVRTNGCD